MIYNTSRLVLRPLTLDDTERLSVYLKRNKDFLKEWEPQRLPEFYYKRNIQFMIKNQEEQNNRLTGIFLGIFFEDLLIGQIGVSSIIYGPFLSCFLGYKLDKDYIGHGFMTEALSEVIKICFNKYKLHRIEANVMPKNIKSISVLEKLNFKNEGLSIKYLKIADKWCDHIHYTLLNENLE